MKQSNVEFFIFSKYFFFFFFFFQATFVVAYFTNLLNYIRQIFSTFPFRLKSRAGWLEGAGGKAGERFHFL